MSSVRALVLLLGAIGSASAFMAASPRSATSRTSAVSMAGKDPTKDPRGKTSGFYGVGSTPVKQAPKGPLGGRVKPGESGEQNWVGDRSQSQQVRAFEAGTDYLFFQGPAPRTAVQDDIPDFFSAENFADVTISRGQIIASVTGAGSALTLALLLNGADPAKTIGGLTGAVTNFAKTAGF